MTAVRASVADIVRGKFGDETGPHVISPFGVELRRVALVGHIVDKLYRENYASLTLDDGTDTIRLKVWGSDAATLEHIESSILALVVGRVKIYGDEVFIAPEIVRELKDPNYMTLHILERYHALLARSGVSFGGPTEEGRVQTEDLTTYGGEDRVTGPPADTADTPAVTGRLAKMILQYIKEHATAEGVPIADIVKHFESKGFKKPKIQLEVMTLLGSEAIIEKSLGRYTVF